MCCNTHKFCLKYLFFITHIKDLLFLFIYVLPLGFKQILASKNIAILVFTPIVCKFMMHNSH